MTDGPVFVAGTYGRPIRLRYMPRKWTRGSSMSESSAPSTTPTNTPEFPLSTRDSSEQNKRSGSSSSTGPHFDGVVLVVANNPPGLGRSPAKTSAKLASSTPQTWTTNRSVSAATSQRSVLGPTTACSRPGSPSATNNDETVSPVRRSPSPDVKIVTGLTRRPRKRRTGSRSSGRSANGCSAWIMDLVVHEEMFAFR